MYDEFKDRLKDFLDDLDAVTENMEALHGDIIGEFEMLPEADQENHRGDSLQDDEEAIRNLIVDIEEIKGHIRLIEEE